MNDEIKNDEKRKEVEYFIVANSCAAPFFSDTSMRYVIAASPAEAMTLFIGQYKHPAGLYAANVYANADAYHKNEKPLYVYRSEKAKKDIEEERSEKAKKDIEEE